MKLKPRRSDLGNERASNADELWFLLPVWAGRLISVFKTTTTTTWGTPAFPKALELVNIERFDFSYPRRLQKINTTCRLWFCSYWEEEVRFLRAFLFSRSQSRVTLPVVCKTVYCSDCQSHLGCDFSFCLFRSPPHYPNQRVSPPHTVVSLKTKPVDRTPTLFRRPRLKNGLTSKRLSLFLYLSVDVFWIKVILSFFF